MKIATQKISEPWTSIGTVLGQPTINDYTFYLKKFKAKKGDIIATVGSSGRSTGPHLDVRLNWFGTRLDPATILNIQ